MASEMANDGGDSAAGDKTQERDPVKELQPNEISYNDLKEFTDNFSGERIIGDKKALGLVYKGVLRDGRVVAVKKLDQEKSPLARDKEFHSKVQRIMELKHENIVEMVGFCRREEEQTTAAEGGNGAHQLVESFLCYKHLPKGCLDPYIFGGLNEVDWSKRFKIIEGICHGLRYLHTRDVPILHMDLKPKTILLDDNISPKIADFGLARFLEKDKTTMLVEDVVGSYGYIAPEYKYNGEISTGSDIYSLGVLILEITTGEKRSPTEDPSSRTYIEKIRRQWTLEHIASTYASLSSNRLEEVKVCLQVALDCVQIEHIRRPTIDTIVDKLTERRT